MQTALVPLTPGEEEAKNRSTLVKLARSRRETRVTFILKGGIEETEDRLQKIYKSVTS